MCLFKSLLVVAVLATAGVTANPVDLSDDLVLRCAPIKCAIHEVCKVIGGRPQCVSKYPVKCGTKTCPIGTVCCNASCNLCTKPGMSCTQQVCPLVLIEALPRAAPESEPDLEPDTMLPPTNPDRPSPGPPLGQRCGPNICKIGQVCCNESCGLCRRPGEPCTKQGCLPTKGEVCGKTVCPFPLHCCNASCGICVSAGGACTQQYCLDEN
jgi:hypothetical protein